VVDGGGHDALTRVCSPLKPLEEEGIMRRRRRRG